MCNLNSELGLFTSTRLCIAEQTYAGEPRLLKQNENKQQQKLQEKSTLSWLSSRFALHLYHISAQMWHTAARGHGPLAHELSSLPATLQKTAWDLIGKLSDHTDDAPQAGMDDHKLQLTML